MESYSTFIKQPKVHAQLVHAIEHLDQIYEKINLVFHEDLYPLKKDSYHFVGKMLKQLSLEDRRSTAFANALFQSAYRSEVTSAGSGFIAFLFGLAFAKEILKSNLSYSNETDLAKQLEQVIEYFKTHLKASTETTGPEDVREVIGACCGRDDVLADAVWEALELSGVEGKIFIENGRQENFVIEHKEGYNFALKPFPFMLSNNSWSAHQCKMLVVDGLVEKVSEIDQVLKESFATKQPMCIIAHGFSEEVAATLKANQNRGMLDIQPVRIPPDIGNLNVANDVAVVCGSTPVSAMKGDVLTFVKYDDIPEVDFVRLTEHLCVIENSKTRSAVSEQIRHILEKRQTYFLHEEVQELFDKRMKSLVSNTVNIYLPDAPTNKQDEQRIKIDLSLRTTKAVLNNGIVNLPQTIERFLNEPAEDNDVNRCFSRALLDLKHKLKHNKDTKNISALSALMGCELTARNILMFLSASGMVELTS